MSIDSFLVGSVVVLRIIYAALIDPRGMNAHVCHSERSEKSP